jgi:hypothetical protein
MTPHDDTKELRDKIDEYGNSIVRLTLQFIHGDISEKDRDAMWKAWGYKLLDSLSSNPNKRAWSEEQISYLYEIWKNLPTGQDNFPKWLSQCKRTSQSTEQETPKLSHKEDPVEQSVGTKEKLPICKNCGQDWVSYELKHGHNCTIFNESMLDKSSPTEVPEITCKCDCHKKTYAEDWYCDKCGFQHLAPENECNHPVGLGRKWSDFIDCSNCGKVFTRAGWQIHSGIALPINDHQSTQTTLPEIEQTDFNYDELRDATALCLVTLQDRLNEVIRIVNKLSRGDV